MFDALKSGSDVAPKWVAAEDEQEQYESRRLWRDLTRAILAKDMDAATEAKTAVENAQRELRATGVKHTTRFFELRDDGCWVPRIQCVSSVPLSRFLSRKLKKTYHTHNHNHHNSTFSSRPPIGFHRIHKRPLPRYRRGYGPGHPTAAHRQKAETRE